MGSRLLGLAALLVTLVPAHAQAFSIASGFTAGCHERIAFGAYQDFLLNLPTQVQFFPDDDDWKELAGYLLDGFPIDLESLDESQQFMLVSLMIGVRAPDTEGHSVGNLAHLRQLHSDPSAIGQYAHALRGPDDNGDTGNGLAVEGTRQLLRLLFHDAYLTSLDDPGDQLIPAPFYLDHYGIVEIEVFAPMYLLGRAAHCMQDSFAHTIRSDEDDLRKIVHVLNYVEAISIGFDEDRDGLAHSDAMDNCLENTDETTAAATEATTDLFIAFRELTEGRDDQAIEHVLDKWIELRPGCDKSNDFCGNERWLEVVRADQTGAYLSCQASEESRRGGYLVVMLLSALALFAVLVDQRQVT